MEKKIMFSAEYTVSSTKSINIKFRCIECGIYVQKPISEIPAANLAEGDRFSPESCQGIRFTFLPAGNCCHED